MSVVTLADAKTHLNITGSTSDAELQTFIDAAEAAAAKEVGTLAPVARTERVRGGRVLVVSSLPIVTLTSVTPVFGTPLDSSFLYMDAAAGVISYYASWFPLPYYDVAYTAGRNVSATSDPDLYKAILEMIRRGWATQRGRTGRQGPPPLDLADLAKDLMAPFLVPGFA